MDENSDLDEVEALRQENEDLKLEIEDLRNELDDVQQDSFFHSNELQQKIGESKEEIVALKDKLKEVELEKQQQQQGIAGTTTASTILGSEDEDSLESGSQFTFHSAFSHDSAYTCRSTAARLELDRAKREIKGLRLELVYAKSKSRISNNNNNMNCGNGHHLNTFSSDASFASSGFHSAASHSHSQFTNNIESGSGIGNDKNILMRQQQQDEKDHSAKSLHAEQERIQKESLYLRMHVKKEKSKHGKEKEKLVREIERLHQSNIFNSKEISRLIDENKKKDDIIRNLKLSTNSNRSSTSVVLLM